jgi:hypothetical protein
MADIDTLIDQVREHRASHARGDTGAHQQLLDAVERLKFAVQLPWDVLWEARFQTITAICKRIAIEMGLLQTICKHNGKPVSSKELSEGSGRNQQLIGILLLESKSTFTK